jgi:acetyltransferase-like isoleucine patch superfamily enzyme
MRFAGLGVVGRLATRLAAWSFPPHYRRVALAHFHRNAYISADAVVHHALLRTGGSVFVDDRCMIFQNDGGGAVELGDKVYIYRDTVIETGNGGTVSIGAGSSIHPRCQLSAYLQPIRVGAGVMIAANCAFYSYDHGMAPDLPIRQQPLCSRGPIVIGDEAWVGTGSIVLSGVTIGAGAVVGAGSVVTRDVPDGAIVGGNPARVIKMRADLR